MEVECLDGGEVVVVNVCNDCEVSSECLLDDV